MPLNSNDKLKLLVDILQNQQTKLDSTMAECSQVNRLIHSLSNDTFLDPHLTQTLNDIYLFNEEAQQQHAMNAYISEKQDTLKSWVSEIDSKTT